MIQDLTDELEEIIKEINSTIKVSKILLFGSCVNGVPNESSDIDLCIITKGTTIRKIELLRQIRKAIYLVAKTPIDLLVYDEKEFDTRSSLSSTMEYQILNQGVKVYEQ